MISDAEATALRELAERVARTLAERDNAILYALKRNTPVARIAELTGLTRGRIYQIKDATKPSR